MTPESDRDLDALLADTKALRQRFRAESAGATPPPHVDAAILAAARRVVNARPTLVGRSPWRCRQVPLAAAAVLVVAASLTLMVERHGGPGLPRETERPAETTSAGPPVEDGAPTAQRPDAAARTGDVQHGAKAPPEGSARARALPPVERALGNAWKDAPSGENLARRSEAPPSRAAAPAVSVPPEADALETKREQKNHAVTAAIPPPATAVEDSRPVRRETARAGESPASVAEGGVRASVPKPAAERPSASVAAAPRAAAPAAALKAQPDEVKSEETLRFSEQAPESTLLAIRKLWEGGQEQRARERLAEFLRQHPGYPLPVDFPVPRPAAEPLKERPPQGR